MSEHTPQAVAKMESKSAVNPSSQGSVLQRTAVNNAPVNKIPPAVHDTLKLPGQPLDDQTRAFMEPRFGHDFSNVRVHTDGKSAEAAHAVNARAYTIGRNVVFDSGEYAPETMAGKRLLAHELTHVVQQKNAPTSDTLVLGASNSSSEREASAVAAQVATGNSVGSISSGVPPQVQREETQDDHADQSLGVLDSSWVDTVASAAIGTALWPLLRELLRGFVGEVNTKLKGGEGQKILDHFAELGHSPKAVWKLYKGYLIGIAKGLWDSLKGIFDILMLGPRALIAAIDWLNQSGPSLLQKFGNISGEVAELLESLQSAGKVVGDVITSFFKNPAQSIEAIKKMGNELIQGALSKARQLGSHVADKAFEFFELEWEQFGEKFGYVVGMVLFEVLLTVVTEGIGPIIEKVASVFSKGARLVVAEASRIFRVVSELAEKLWGILKGLKKTALDAFTKLGEVLGTVLQKLRVLADKVIGFFEVAEEGATAGGAFPIPKRSGTTLLSEGADAGKVASRTTKTTVEELRPPKVAETPPKVTKLPPGPEPKGGITAQPKGGTPATSHDVSALTEQGVNPRGAFPRAPRHHIFPQEFEEWFNERGIKDIDEFTVELSEGEHSATHTMKWNPKWKEFITKNPKATPKEIFAFATKLRKEFKLDKLPLVPFKD